MFKTIDYFRRFRVKWSPVLQKTFEARRATSTVARVLGGGSFQGSGQKKSEAGIPTGRVCRSHHIFRQRTPTWSWAGIPVYATIGTTLFETQSECHPKLISPGSTTHYRKHIYHNYCWLHMRMHVTTQTGRKAGPSSHVSRLKPWVYRVSPYCRPGPCIRRNLPYAVCPCIATTF